MPIPKRYRHSEQTLKNYFFLLLFGACVNTDAATLFIAFVDFGSLKILDAFDATLFEVCSDLAILN